MRKFSQQRTTTETNVFVDINLDGTGKSEIVTGIAFFDHMLQLFARHGLFDLIVKVQGDLAVDMHHTVEDTGIVLGHCIQQALGNKEGIQRYGTMYLPMDETLTRTVLDFSGRAFFTLNYNNKSTIDSAPNFPSSLIKEFFRSLSHNMLANLHMQVLYGEDGHHVVESLFKGCARAIRQAITIQVAEQNQIPSTKGIL